MEGSCVQKHLVHCAVHLHNTRQHNTEKRQDERSCSKEGFTLLTTFLLLLLAIISHRQEKVGKLCSALKDAHIGCG